MTNLYKRIKYLIRGFVWGFIVATILWGSVAYPYTNFRITATNMPKDQVFAMDNSAELKDQAKDFMKQTKKQEIKNVNQPANY